MKLKQYMESKEVDLWRKQEKFKKLGLKFYPKWDDFIKNNMKVIDGMVADIKKNTSMIADKKKADKKFKEEMRSSKIELTGLWSAMKGE